MTSRLRLHPSTQRFDDGRICFGGSPRRVIRLTTSGARLLDELLLSGATSPTGAALAARLCRAGLAVPVPPPAPVETAGTIAVVVPVLDRSEDLDRCLASLAMADRVVVIDDGSHDAAAVASVAKRHGARLVRHPSSLGPAAARNRGLEVVASELPACSLVAFVDSDVVASMSELLSLAAHLADPTIVAVAPRVLPQSANNVAIARFLAASSPLDLGADSGFVRPLTPIGHVPTACLLARLSGLPTPAFDEQLRYGEDVDLVWRLGDAGATVWYDATVTVRHREPTTWRTAMRRRFTYGTSAAPLSARHPRRLTPLIVRPASAAATFGAVVGGPTGWLVAIAGFGVPALRLRRRLISVGLPKDAANRHSVDSQIAAFRGNGGFVVQFLAPLAAALGWRRPSSRLGLALLLVANPLASWRQQRPNLDPIRWTIGCWANDAAYGAGVVTGAVRGRRLAPLLPQRGIIGNSDFERDPTKPHQQVGAGEQ